MMLNQENKFTLEEMKLIENFRRLTDQQKLQFLDLIAQKLPTTSQPHKKPMKK